MAPLVPQLNEPLEEIRNDQTPIQQFYANKNILMTGVTGFLGKILIDKLLRTCDVNNIYVVVRNKKGKDIHSRIDDVFDDPLFERLKKEQPKFRHKILAISGDCSLPELGISPEERLTLQKNVQVVFHVAATVRFDEKLKLALGINVSGTKEMLDLCKEMENLKAVVHVSTAYANCNRPDIDEKFYKTRIGGENALKLSECLDDKLMDSITPTLIQEFPNTYTFTKSLAEDLVKNHCKGLPLAIFRPAIVISTYNEPVSGWVDNMYGPTGILVGVGAGLLRVLNIEQDYNAEIVPVDMCVNSLIASAWEVGTVSHEEVPIYNYVTSRTNPITWRTYCTLSSNTGIKMPMSKSVWYMSFKMTSNIFLVYLMKFFYHILPALIMDLGLLCVGKKPKMHQIYKKIHKFCDVITYFTSRKWYFNNDNVKNLWQKLDERDKAIYFFDMETLDWTDFIEKSMFGMRKYLIKEDPENIPQAIKRNQRLKYLHYTVIYSLYAIVLFIIYLMVFK